MLRTSAIRSMVPERTSLAVKTDANVCGVTSISLASWAWLISKVLTLLLRVFPSIRKFFI